MELTKIELEKVLDTKLSKQSQLFDQKLSNLVTNTNFDKTVKGLATKDDLKSFATKDDLSKATKGLATKDDLAAAISASEKKIIARIDLAQEELAIITKSGFDDVFDRLDVKERVEKLEKDMVQMKMALRLS